VNQLIWRLHRNQAYFALAALAVLAVLLLVTGVVMAQDYHRFLATCAITQSCGDGQELFSGDGFILDLVNLTMVVPLLFGLFWGAPLVAKELEEGTHNLVWTQGVTRRHWLTTNVTWVVLAAAGWGVALTSLVSWWRSPENALDTRFDAFDVQGIAPVAYSIFAVTLGIGIGSLFKRVLPAIAVTLGIFVALRVSVAVYLRPHYLAPLSRVIPFEGPGATAPAGSWFLSSSIVGPSGTSIGRGFTPDNLPAACRSIPVTGKGGILQCVSSHGFHQLISYQPAGRFWTFQGMEAVIFLVLSAGMIALAYWRVLTRDA
jgi:hypothetical protein